MSTEHTALYKHEPHYHEPRNVNQTHAEEQRSASFNQRLAVGLTRAVGTVWTAYAFAVLAFVGLAGITGWLPPLVIVLVTWISQTFLQLVFLPILSVGQSVLGKHAEMQSDEQFATTRKIYHELTQLKNHLDAQDQHVAKHLDEIDARVQAILNQLQPKPAPLESVSPVVSPATRIRPARKREQA